MRNPTDVLAEKLKQYHELMRDINALRIVIPMLAEPEPPKEQPRES